MTVLAPVSAPTLQSKWVILVDMGGSGGGTGDGWRKSSYSSAGNCVEVNFVTVETEVREEE